MASGLFTSAANELWGTGTRLDWDTDTWAAALIDAGAVTISRTTHDRYDDISAGQVATINLTTSAPAAGVIDASDATWPTVSGNTAEQVVLYKNTGTPSTSPLFLLFDAGGFTSGMPVTPNSGDITLTFNPSGIASLI